MMTANVLRQKFLDFFEMRKHKVVESDSLVPAGDPTVLFTPAGMNQFKKQFMGSIGGFRRAASSQRCLRTDDLDKVGKTSGHHTFFEMLGNFSFGDYFKKEAIPWAWEFLTGELKIDPDKLWVSVYQDDEEAYKIWKDTVKVPVERIVKLGDKDNFWPAEAREKGPNGPCGPCSEIFYDFGKDVGCKEPVCDPSCSCGRFVEIWNLVFTQFNRKDGGKLEPLPNKNIDTGMGLERLAAVMQGVKNNFETELFQPLIKAITNYELRVTNYEFIYAIADHIRAISFAIYDGVLPSNEDRGYVVRKLIRKCMLHLRTLGIRGQFLYKLVPILARIMHVSYPELKEREADIKQIIFAEENSFFTILNSSPQWCHEKYKNFAKKGNPEKAGEIAFQLYDTYGVPFEVTKEWLDNNNIAVSVEAFNRQMSQQKNRSKAQSAMTGDVFSAKELHLAVKATKFIGYTKFEARAKILGVIGDEAKCKKISKNQKAKIILDQSCFYAESGGQVGDTGTIVKGKNIFQVQDTQIQDKVIVHIGLVKEGSFKPNDAVTAKVDLERRLAIARNHTATHLLQAALRKILGKHVKQQGSLVAQDRLRFDFTHFAALSPEELKRVEEEVYKYVIENHPVSLKQMLLTQAKKSGALAFFGEKYADKVRVVSAGEISKEFCGGTHLDSTGQIGLFKILREGSVASGVRRIEAVTGMAAYQAVQARAMELEKELQDKLQRINKLEKELARKESAAAMMNVDDIIKTAENIKNIDLISGQPMKNLDMDTLRKTVDLIKQKMGNNTIIALGSDNAGKAMLVIGVTADLCAKGIDAANLIRRVAVHIGGSGGGRPDFAQAGGNKPENFDAAFKELKNIINNLK